MTGKWRLTKQGETVKRIHWCHRFHFMALPCGRLVGSGAIRRHTCGGEHDPGGLYEPNTRHIPQLWVLAAVRTTVP